MKKLMISVSLLTASIALAAPKSVKVIYGDDNRVDVYESTNSMYVELAKSTAGMVSKYSISPDGNGNVLLKGSSLQARGMCSTERFANQPTVASCSGFLVGEDLLVTAGHCIKNTTDCDRYRWVFDYKVENDTQTSVSVSEDNVYSCAEVINTILDNTTMNDFALIRLDRKVTDRRVLQYRKSGKIGVGANLVVIGHPSGLPSKIADGAVVRKLHNNYFSANLDTYGGNSGSAVFNADTGVIEGILVRGANDYNYDSTRGCSVSNVISNTGGRGEDVTYITNIPELQQ
jgi:V8-like Glu-specific endopeptidase